MPNTSEKVRDVFESNDFMFDETFTGGDSVFADFFAGPKADQLVERITLGIDTLHAHRADWPNVIDDPIDMNDTGQCVAGQVAHVGIMSGWYDVLVAIGMPKETKTQRRESGAWVQWGIDRGFDSDVRFTPETLTLDDLATAWSLVIKYYNRIRP